MEPLRQIGGITAPFYNKNPENYIASRATMTIPQNTNKGQHNNNITAGFDAKKKKNR